MAKSEIIVGLDVGTTKVCAVVGEVTKNGVELAGHGISPCQGLQKGMVVDIDATVLSIEEAVEMAQQATGFQIRAVAVGVTGEHVRSLNSRGTVEIQRFRDITQEDLDQAMEAAQKIDLPAGREIIHNIARGYSIDGHQGVRRPVGMSGTRLEVETHIVTAETSFLQNVIKCVHQADLSIIPNGIILEPLATAEAVLSAEERELGVALVDIGGGTSDIALFRAGGVFHTSVIPVGGNHVTNDLAVGLRVARTEAERIKLQHGTALDEGIEELDAIAVTPLGQPAGDGIRIPKRIIPEIVQPRMEELFELVADEIARAEATHLLPAGLVISGGGSQLSGTLDVASRALGIPVRLGAPQHPAAATGALRSPSFATGVGLVTYAARHGRAARQREGHLLEGLFSGIGRWLRGILSR